MMQLVPKWKVTVLFVGKAEDVTFWMFDHSISNVLRQVAAMSFSENGLEQPASIIVSESGPSVNIQSNITTSVPVGGFRVDPVVRT